MNNRTKAKIMDKIYRALNKGEYGGVLDAHVCSQLQYLPDYKDIKIGSDTADIFCIDEQSVKPDKNNYKRGYRLELIKKGILIDENRTYEGDNRYGD